MATRAADVPAPAWPPFWAARSWAVIAALAAYGGTSAGHGGSSGALAAVLLYWLINYWAVLPAGGICYLSLRRALTASVKYMRVRASRAARESVRAPLGPGPR